MTQEVRGLLNKSKHAIKVSQELLAQGYPSDSASKSYDAIFYPEFCTRNSLPSITFAQFGACNPLFAYLDNLSHRNKLRHSPLTGGFCLCKIRVYAAQALLKSAKIDVVKHSAVESAIGYHCREKIRS